MSYNVRMYVRMYSYRVVGDMIEMYKMMSGKYDSEVCDFIERTDETSITRGHIYKIDKNRAHLDIRKYSFVFRNINILNNLPHQVIEAETIVKFERLLDNHWKEETIKYNYQDVLSSTTNTKTQSIRTHKHHEDNEITLI